MVNLRYKKKRVTHRATRLFMVLSDCRLSLVISPPQKRLVLTINALALGVAHMSQKRK